MNKIDSPERLSYQFLMNVRATQHCLFNNEAEKERKMGGQFHSHFKKWAFIVLIVFVRSPKNQPKNWKSIPFSIQTYIKLWKVSTVKNGSTSLCITVKVCSLKVTNIMSMPNLLSSVWTEAWTRTLTWSNSALYLQCTLSLLKCTYIRTHIHSTCFTLHHMHIAYTV